MRLSLPEAAEGRRRGGRGHRTSEALLARMNDGGLHNNPAHASHAAVGKHCVASLTDPHKAEAGGACSLSLSTPAGGHAHHALCHSSEAAQPCRPGSTPNCAAACPAGLGSPKMGQGLAAACQSPLLPPCAWGLQGLQWAEGKRRALQLPSLACPALPGLYSRLTTGMADTSPNLGSAYFLHTALRVLGEAASSSSMSLMQGRRLS